MTTLLHGDCLELMKSIPDKSVDMVLTDIPYGEVNRSDNGLRKLDKGNADVFEIDMELMLGEFMRIARSCIYIFCGIGQVSILRDGMRRSGLSTRLIIWEKSNPSPMNGKHIWLSGVECCVYGKFKGGIHNAVCKNTVFRYPCGSSKVHPTQKPVALMETLITASSNRGGSCVGPIYGKRLNGCRLREHGTGLYRD